MKHFLILTLVCFTMGCIDPASDPDNHDLIIRNATILNTITGQTELHKTIVIDSGVITAVLDAETEVEADSIIDANEKLVTPGFIDAVGHLDDVFGERPDTMNLQLASVPDCIKKFSDTYLPYGVTTVRSSGDGSGYYVLGDYLNQYRDPATPDFYFSGGSLAGWYEGSPYINHLLVQDSSEVDYWINTYNRNGLSSIKIYCNNALTYPLFTEALYKATSLEMVVTSQVQSEITIDSALSLGLRNFEHASTLCYQRNLFHFNDDVAFNDTIEKYWHSQEDGIRVYRFLEAANFVGADNPQIAMTIRNMKQHNATMTTSLHFFAQWLGKTWFCSTPKAARFETQNFTEQQKLRCVNGYAILAKYVKAMYDAGVPLVMGADHKDGGKAMLSEILLLNELGIPMENVFQIATINTARAIRHDDQYGSIEKGKRANLVIFDANPLEDPKNVLGTKTVIKDGSVFR
ncbi:MAG TPA: amidohydrolase family protein [Bacteroidia bacterium]|nr:amidohydrolase family protein [Bacteroidia bacterium]